MAYLGIHQQHAILRACLQRQRSKMVCAPLVHEEEFAARKVIGAEHVGLVCITEHMALVRGKVRIGAVRNAAAMLVRKHQHARE